MWARVLRKDKYINIVVRLLTNMGTSCEGIITLNIKRGVWGVASVRSTRAYSLIFIMDSTKVYIFFLQKYYDYMENKLKVYTGEEYAALEDRQTVLERRFRTLEGVVYDQSVILSEIRGQLAGIRARVTTSERTTSGLTPKEKLDRELQKLAEKLPIDVSDNPLFKNVKKPDTEVKETDRYVINDLPPL